MGRDAIREAKSRVIEDTIRQYFQQYAIETYRGRVCTEDVITHVRKALKKALGARMTPYNMGEVFDHIRDLGPVGEGDTHWLKTWAKLNKIVWQEG